MYSLNDAIFSVIVLVITTAVYSLLRRMAEPHEIRTFDLGYGFHVLSGLAMTLIYWPYYGGDVGAYQLYGVPLAEALSDDFAHIGPELVNAFLQRNAELPYPLLGGGSTGSMTVVAVFLFFFFGNSVVASSLFLGFLAFTGKILAYKGLAPDFKPEHHRALRLALFFFPTGVIWSTILLKESIAVIAMGPLIYAVRLFLDRRSFILQAFFIFGSGLTLLMMKPYLLIAFGAAAAIWIVRVRVLGKAASLFGRPIYFAAALGALFLVLGVLGTIFPSLSIQQVGSSMSKQRTVSANEIGGSNFRLEEAPSTEEAAERGLTAQISLIPLALLTAFYRPTLLEVNNIMLFINALETTWLLVLTLGVFRFRKQIIPTLFSSPGISFCFVFVLVVAIGTGLSTANLGTLSRYRAPMIPYFAALLLVIRAGVRERKETEALEEEQRTAPARGAFAP